MGRCAAILSLFLLSPAARAAEPNVISRVSVEDRGGEAVLVVEGSRPPSFTTWASERPARFVVEVAGAALRVSERALAPASGPVESVRAEEVQGEGTTKARVAVTLRGELEGAEVTTRGNALVVSFGRRARAAAPHPDAIAAPSVLPAGGERELRPAIATPPVRPEPFDRLRAGEVEGRERIERRERQEVREFGFRPLPDGARVYLRTVGPPRFALEEQGETLLLVKLDRARARRNDARPLDTRFFRGPVDRVTPRRVGDGYVLEIALRAKVPYEQRVEGDLLAIDFRTPAK